MNMFMRLLGLGLSALALTTLTSGALAESYPDKIIRFVVPYPPGGASDVTARIIGQKLTEAWGQQVVVDNHPGANGNIAAELVARAPADGYTMLMGNVGPNAISAGLYPNLTYNVVTSFAPVTLTTTVPIVLLVNPSLPVKNVKELIAYAKANPNKLNFASAGNGSSNHLTGELFKSTTGIDIVHVPYKGDAPALTDVMGGQVSMMFTTVVAAMPHIKSGKLRALAVASAKRTASMPDLPTIAESGVPGFDSSSWGGILFPAGTPKEIIAKMHDAVVKILAMPDVKERLSSLGAVAVGNTPEEFGSYIKSETVKWSKVIKTSGASVN
jgi:tripartite-type tricarboxylate transporter receptor subunit TctC